MHIDKITIKNYRNFKNFSMEFNSSLNVITGGNNSGKTGLLKAIYQLSNPSLTINDFNRNTLLKFKDLYVDDAPSIEFGYVIKHTIDEDNPEDESIVRLLPFLGLDNIHKSSSADDNNKYELTAKIKVVWSLDSKAIGEYQSDVKEAKNLTEFLAILSSYEASYTWKFYNVASDEEENKKRATGIFDISFISADRGNDEVDREVRKEINEFSKEQKNSLGFKTLVGNFAEELKDLAAPVLLNLANLFDREYNNIGLQKGNVSIVSDLKPVVSVADSFVTEVKDTHSECTLPLEYNGLGYNNLISIYMILQLREIQKGKDFKVLCLEEPEAHLHPAMQYKLFKYIRDLADNNQLSQQVFVTTHSSNIAAVAGLDNMFMLSYVRKGAGSDCISQSLHEQFLDVPPALSNSETKEVKEESKPKELAKKHLSKFLDVTRSDMLFADKVILVEGLAEKLLLPKFMEICGYPYEDNHISIVEIGGKHFEYFIELFNKNAIEKKVLCITDRDYIWTEPDGDSDHVKKWSEYGKEEPDHVKGLKAQFKIDNLKIVFQSLGGSTFEDELFLANYGKEDSEFARAKALIKIAGKKKIFEMVESYGLDFSKWFINKPSDPRSIVTKYLNLFQRAINEDPDNVNQYEKLFFAKIFLYYAQTQKGNIALSILTNEILGESLVVPDYVKEGLEWLIK